MTALLIAGVDEVGRGPLAGPVVAAAVILDPAHPVAGLRDSKKLSEKRRLQVAEEIRVRSLSWSLGRAEVSEIDEINILQASLLAMKRAVEGLTVSPSEVLVDGNHVPDIRYSVRAIIGGDATVAQISAASILAKVARDEEMMEMHERYPVYGFDRHKGYPTATHLEALRSVGPSRIHRMSFAPCRETQHLAQTR